MAEHTQRGACFAQIRGFLKGTLTDLLPDGYTFDGAPGRLDELVRATVERSSARLQTALSHS